MIETVNTTRFAHYANETLVRLLDAAAKGVDTQAGRLCVINAEQKLQLTYEAMAEHSEAEAAVYFNLATMVESMRSVAHVS